MKSTSPEGMGTAPSICNVKARALMYHDVVENKAYDSSGFRMPGADGYKLNRAEFARHLVAIQETLPKVQADLANRPESWPKRGPLFLTFDDGGVSAYGVIAGLLEKIGWHGHFFVTTNYIGKSGFLNSHQIKELRKRGHVIGSHSCSHPARISQCSREQLIAEWGQSARVLSEILGEAVTVASVPGGFYSRAVAQAASAAGIRVLFNSEPTLEAQVVVDCLVVGRYSIQRGTSSHTAAALAAGRPLPRAQQWLLWNAKKAAKRLGGEYWLKLRRQLLPK